MHKMNQCIKFIHFSHSSLIGALTSDNDDIHKNVVVKQTSHHFILFHDYLNSPCYLKEGDFGWS